MNGAPDRARIEGGERPEPPRYPALTPDEERRRRKRSIAIALALGAMVVNCRSVPPLSDAAISARKVSVS